MTIEQLVEKFTPIIEEYIKDAPERVNTQADLPHHHTGSLLLWKAGLEPGMERVGERNYEEMRFSLWYTESQCVGHSHWRPSAFFFSYQTFKNENEPIKRYFEWMFNGTHCDELHPTYIRGACDTAFRQYQADNATNNYISPVLGVMQHDKA